MEVIVDSHPGGIGVVRPVGRLDLLTAPELRQSVAQAIAAGNRRLIVDLAEVPFIDSSGLAALISGLKAARLAGGDLRIARPTDQARLLFELTRLDQVLRPYPTVEEALAGY
jgi:anti-sigma B factor antagonist